MHPGPETHAGGDLIPGAVVLQVWLQKYGYLPPTEPRLAVLRSAEAMQSALAAMQQFYGINMTGKVDRSTIE